MSLYSITLAPTDAAATTVCASQSPGAGAITINGTAATGGVATLGGAQLVTLVSGGVDTGITFTITGTDADGKAVSETVTGASAGTATSTKHFKTVTSITHTGSVAGTFSSGCTADAVSASFQPFRHARPGRISVGVVLVAGTATYEMQDCFTNIVDGQALGTWHQNATLNGKSASFVHAYGDLFPFASRLRTTATSSGSLKANFVVIG